MYKNSKHRETDVEYGVPPKVLITRRLHNKLPDMSLQQNVAHSWDGNSDGSAILKKQNSDDSGLGDSGLNSGLNGLGICSGGQNLAPSESGLNGENLASIDDNNSITIPTNHQPRHVTNGQSIGRCHIMLFYVCLMYFMSLFSVGNFDFLAEISIFGLKFQFLTEISIF